MAENSKNEPLNELMAHVARSADSRGIPLSQLSKAAGVSAAFLQSCLAGTRSLAPTRLVQLCREAGIAFPVVADALKGVVDERNYLRISTAAKPYECSYCGTGIRKETQYVRLEPFGPTRQSGAPIQYFCRPCAVSARWLEEVSPDASQWNEIQLELPLWSLIKPTTVQLVDVSASLCERIAADPRELFELSPPRFEALILDRLSAMGFAVYPVGHTYTKDGGIDIIFTPPKSYPFPFLGAAQVKHHRNIDRKVGPAPVRELAGVMAAKGLFSAGLIITNTSFTPDAKAFAEESREILKLRDFDDLMRWVRNNFTDDAEWREIPKRIKLCDGVYVDIN